MLKDFAEMFVGFIFTAKENIRFRAFYFYFLNFFCLILPDVNFVHILKEELILS